MTAAHPALLYVLYRYPQLSQTFVTNEVHGLRRLGADVDVIALEGSDHHEVDPGLAGSSRALPRPSPGRALRDHAWFAVRHPRTYTRFLGAVVALRDHVRLALLRLPTEARRLRAGGRPECCHTHFAWSTASIAAYLARLLGAQGSITLHAKDIYTADRRHLAAQLGRFDRIVTVCEYNARILRALAPRDGVPVAIVPCGVEVPEDASTEADGPDVISVGRLVDKKGFDTLLRAVALSREKLPGIRVTIVGEGPEHAALERLVAELGLGANVTLAGAVEHSRTLQLIGSSKVFCLAAQRAADGDCDALPVVLREAMARAVPVISTKVAGIPETIDDEVGWLVAPRSPEPLADAIVAALGDESQRRRRGAAGRERVSARWTVDAQVDGMLDVFGGPRSPG